MKKIISLLTIFSVLNVSASWAASFGGAEIPQNDAASAKADFVTKAMEIINSDKYANVDQSVKDNILNNVKQHVDGVAQTRSPTRSVGSNLANLKSGEEELNALSAETIEDVNKQEYEKNKKSVLAKIEQSIAKISVGSVYQIPIEWKDNTEIQTALAKWKKACNEKAKKPAHAEELSGEDDAEKISVKCVIKTCDDGYTRTDNNKKCTKETKVEKQTECTNDRGGTWKLSACYCGNIIMTQGAICQDDKIVSEKAQNKESCNANEETTWKGGKCVCKDSTKELTDKGCTEKVSNTTAATGIGGMELAQGLAEQKAESELENAYNKDVDALIGAFNSVAKKLTDECTKAGKTINNGVCQ